MAVMEVCKISKQWGQFQEGKECQHPKQLMQARVKQNQTPKSVLEPTFPAKTNRFLQIIVKV